MNTNVVAQINGVNILASSQSEGLVPVKPVCEALGIAYESQVNKIKEHPIFGSSILLRDMVAADGKKREMICLSIEVFPGWLFSINPQNVKEEAKLGLMAFQFQCNKVLFHYFFGSQQKQLEQNQIEINLLENIAKLDQQKAAINCELSEMKRRLNQLREERLKNEPSLF